MKRQVIRGIKMPEPDNLPKPPELPLSHKTLIQWEANVDKNPDFKWRYIYHFNEEKQCAEIEVVGRLNKTIIEYTFGRTLPYKLIVGTKEIFVSDKLRDIIKWMNNNTIVQP